MVLCGMVLSGSQGKLRRGKVRFGLAWQARHGEVWCGIARSGKVRLGSHGEVRPGVVCCGCVWCVGRFGLVWQAW